MTREMEYKIELYRKMEQEYSKLIKELESSDVRVVLDRAYEKVIKEELLGMFYPDTCNLDINQIRVFSRVNYPLDQLYVGWLDSDVNLNQFLEDNVSNTMGGVVEYERMMFQETAGRY